MIGRGAIRTFFNLENNRNIRLKRCTISMIVRCQISEIPRDCLISRKIQLVQTTIMYNLQMPRRDHYRYDNVVEIK